jgi:ADP-glucose pyrophosphorylase
MFDTNTVIIIETKRTSDARVADMKAAAMREEGAVILEEVKVFLVVILLAAVILEEVEVFLVVIIPVAVIPAMAAIREVVIPVMVVIPEGADMEAAGRLRHPYLNRFFCLVPV